MQSSSEIFPAPSLNRVNIPVIPWVRLFAPLDIAALVYFRVAFGAIMLWEVARYFQNGWIYEYYIQPTFHFAYFGFEWAKPWPGEGMMLHFALLGLLALCLLLGLLYRLSALLFFLGFSYVFLLDQARYLNHFYLISLVSFLMIFIPAGRAFSLDSWRKPAQRAETAPAWSLWLLRAQIGLVYFFGGIAKLNGDWLRGEPMRMWLAERGDFPLIGVWFTEEWMVYLFSFGGLLLDLLFLPLVLWPRTRRLALLAALVFHLTNARLFSIGIFPWFMLAANLLFLDPAWPRFRWLRRLPAEQPPAASLGRYHWIIISLLGLYLAWQILMPLRHFLYPGDVNWTEEGHRFSWHMKLRSKDGEARFYISNPSTGASWQVNLADYLADFQEDEMLSRPDMLLQFAHAVAADARADGHQTVEIRVWAMASLNGREPQLMIDPTVNLAAQPRNLLASPWILSLQEE